MRQLYIFDYDGVIADSLDAWISVIGKIGEKYGYIYRMTRDNVNELEQVTMDGILEKSGRKREESEDYLSEIYTEMEKNSRTVSFFSGINYVIKKLHETGNTVCVNTANSSTIVADRLEHENLGKYVAEVIGGDHSGSKSEKIHYLMEKYNFSHSLTWMIGDTRGDIIEGKKAGVMTAAVTYGWHHYENMADTKPDRIFRTIAELEDFLAVKV